MVHKSDSDELAALRAENARLVSLLEAHGIEWRRKPPISVQRVSVLSTNEKVALFRRLFRGRDDVWALRWESKTSGKSGYSPACANEWQARICGKGHYSSMRDVYTESIPVKAMSGSLILWIPRIQCCSECGINASGVIRRWGTGLWLMVKGFHFKEYFTLFK